MNIKITYQNPVGIVILAAGASRRLGQPKQLLSLGSQNLIQQSVGAAIQSEAQDVCVILGGLY
ncbi:MAG: NTP transferase domain-containing protein [Bacteroidia bacterium]|nr:NTP transferase domain-containing protein [Bacteroidia bacterium]